MQLEYQKLVASHERIRQQWLIWNAKPKTPVTEELCELFMDVMAFLETAMSKARTTEVN